MSKNHTKVKPSDRAQISDFQMVKGIRRDWQLILIFLLPFTVLLIFQYIPMFGTLYAFQDVGLRTDFLDKVIILKIRL